jgi:hypothetical protein
VFYHSTKQKQVLLFDTKKSHHSLPPPPLTEPRFGFDPLILDL